MKSAQLVSVMIIVIGATDAMGQQCLTERASVNSQGQQASSDCLTCSLSYDGRFVGFASYASNLVPGDTNAKQDAFVRDRQLQTTERVSISSNGAQGNDSSGGAWLSGDGRYALFYSWASNLHPDDPDSLLDVYLHDRQTKVTELISRRLPGKPSKFGCSPGAISSDGRFVVFWSEDTNLVSQPDTNGDRPDIFLVDRQTGTIELVSLDSSGSQASAGAAYPHVSDDGRFVTMISESADWQPAGQLGYYTQVFLRDRQNGTLVLVSAKPNGLPGSYPSSGTTVSGDGRYVAFESRGDDLVLGEPPNGHVMDAYVRDLHLGVTELISWSKDGTAAFSGAREPSLSTNGRFVVFVSESKDLVVQDFNFWMTDVFVRDLSTKVTTLVSRSWQGLGIPTGGDQGVISGDGHVAGFMSADDTVVPGKIGHLFDVFVNECNDGLTSIWCAWTLNSLGCRPVVSMDGSPSVSGTGGFHVDCNLLVSKKVGLFYYGTTGTQGAVFQTGFQCVKPPLSRAAGMSTGGLGPPSDCSGSLSFDLDEWVAFRKDAMLVPGTTVYGQFWSRDPGAAPPTHLSSAVAFILQP